MRMTEQQRLDRAGARYYGQRAIANLHLVEESTKEANEWRDIAAKVQRALDAGRWADDPEGQAGGIGALEHATERAGYFERMVADYTERMVKNVRTAVRSAVASGTVRN